MARELRPVDVETVRGARGADEQTDVAAICKWSDFGNKDSSLCRLPHMAQRWYMRLLQPMWHAFWAVPGTAVYRGLQSGAWVYATAVWQKQI